MRVAKAARSLLLSALLTATPLAATLAPAGSLHAQPATLEVVTAGDLSSKVWSSAMGGRGLEAFSPLSSISSTSNDPSLALLRRSYAELDANFKKADGTRIKKLDEAWKELEKDAGTMDSMPALSKGLKHAVEVQMLSTDHKQVLEDERIKRLVTAADAAARKAEAAGDWLGASDLFFRLHTLLDESGIYKKDVERLSDRLGMLRLYVPKRLHDLRVAQAQANGEKEPIPPFNALGEDFDKKLDPIDETMVLRAVYTASDKHVEHDETTLARMAMGGLTAIRTMVTTPDLQQVFPGLSETESRERMIKFIDEKIAKLSVENATMSGFALRSLSRDLLGTNKQTVRISDKALLHEFGNGAMAQLDEFTAIIWPDEKSRFDRMTQGEFFGVGVQIQFDKDAQAIKVVTPLDGTPAQRAGVHAGDVIKKINGESAIGLTTNQAVDLITGPKGSKVSLTMERSGEEKVFELERDKIPLISVKGWKRTGPRETDWDWFIDEQNKIGYVRLLQFQEDTTDMLKQAVAAMKDHGGVNGIILDLRFNPGGLLTQAHSVANAFIDKGTIVSTTSGDKLRAQSDRLLVHDIPIAVLINEGSASASEIVSGAIRHYADEKQIQAILIGARSFGKGSVQNVLRLNDEDTAALKLTTQYYKVPTNDGQGYILHRRPGATTWGVDAHVKVEMLPDQIADAIKLRQDADVLVIDETNQVVKGGEPAPDPTKLITDGIDLQLQTALVLLQSQVVGKKSPQARVDQ
jgi:carboxyl-terminal processing protease